MTDRAVSGLRVVDPPFVAPGPTGVAVRTRLRVTDTEADVLARVGVFLGGLAGMLSDQERWPSPGSHWIAAG